MSSQTKSKDVCASKSIAGCTSQHRGGNTIKSSGKKVVNDDEFMVPSICSPRIYRYSTQEHADKSKPQSTTNPHKSPSMSKSSAKCYSTVNKHLDRMNEADMRLMNSPKVKEKEAVQVPKGVEVKEKDSSIQASEKFKDKYAKLCQMRNKVSNINRSDNNSCQPTSVNGKSTEAKNPTATRNPSSCKPCTDVDSSNWNSNLLERSPREGGAKRKRQHHSGEQNDDLSDDSVECIPGWELSPDEIAGAIGPKHFWKARRAIQNQQRVFAVQVFELHKLIKVQKLIAASPHLLIEGDPVLGNALMGKRNKLPKGNLKVQTLSITNKDDIQPTLEQPELSKQNTEGNPSHHSRDDGLDDNHHDQAAANETFTSNPPAIPVAPDNKQNNWCMNPPQNQWLVPVMSPSEGLVYKPYAGPCPPVGNLLTPFYANCTPLRLPSTPYGVPMPHQPQQMVPPGAPAMHMNYFPPFSMPVMNPGTPASAVEQGSHAAAPQPQGHMEQQSLISCNMSHPSGIWRFLASRDSEPQASSASSPFDRLEAQGDGSGPVSFFPKASVLNAQPQPSSGGRDQQNHVIRVVPRNAQTASVPNAQPQPSSGGRDQQNHVIRVVPRNAQTASVANAQTQPSSGGQDQWNHVIRVVPHNAQTASESAARIFRSIQMERKQNDS
ncbi:hypothetical protein BDA96_03G208000 [Sorghum bicolor]|nr:protein HEADING DATE 3B isoform X3 [Sorghum bicolor]KAG0538121.1 hypothetical protein BDA96_03G208000 [Sorghum bicolor]OQU87023.1 hypothetical protein SORBI_3003G191700 [Sorghum bicolor]|eukprot:XP_021312234.1 protein HEADING DATE 3B isoform X3 [Sorghum bicolor]